MSVAPGSSAGERVAEPAPTPATPNTNEGTSRNATTTALPTHSDGALAVPGAPTASKSPAMTTLKRPRAIDPATQLLNPAFPSTSFSSTAARHGSEEGSSASDSVPPKQVRTEGSGSPATPHSPYANLPRKVPRKVPVSTPSSSLGTPHLVSPDHVSPALASPPQSLPSPTAAASSGAGAKLAALHQRWATLLHKVLMQERAPHETEAVMELSMRIVAALPGDLEETKDGFQTLLFSMKDAKNGELRRKVVEGELLVERLVRMDDRELANPELRQKIEATMEVRAKDTNLSEIAKAQRTSNSTLFKCKTCGARDTSWYQRQTRSGDEPMTVIITCNRCNTQWRKY